MKTLAAPEYFAFGVSSDLPRGGDGYFLEPVIIVGICC